MIRLRRTRLDVHVGIDLSPGRFKLVALTTGPVGPLVAFAADQPLSAGDEHSTRFDAAAIGAELASILARQRLRPRSVALALGPGEAVSRRLLIVDQQPAQMLTSVALQLGQALGADVTKPRVGYAALPAQAPAGRITVLAAAARAEAVAAQQRAVAAAGCEQGPVVPAAAALLNAWRRCPGEERAGMVVLLHVGHSAALWMVVAGRDPLAMDAPLVGVSSILERLGSRSTSGAAELPAIPATLLGEWTGRLRQEIARGVQAVKRESGRGEEEGYEVWVSGGGARVPGFLEALATSLGSPVHLYDPLRGMQWTGEQEEVFGPALVPAFGAALQGLVAETGGDEALLQVNLRAPAEGRPASPGRVPLPLLAQQVARDPAWRGVAAAALTLWVTTAVLGGRLTDRDRELAERERRIAADSAVVAASMSRMEFLEARRSALGAQVDAVAAMERSRYTWPRLLHGIAESVPGPAWVSDILSDGEDPATGAVSFRVRGYAANDGVAGAFARRLTDTRAADEAQVVRTSAVRIGRSALVQFEIAGRVGTPDAASPADDGGRP
jgi:Tfp pilus assembly PilM family ATPase